MTVQSIADAIEHCRAVFNEWPEFTGWPALGWREVDTRYAFIDPLLRGLGWNIDDPKECFAEYPRGAGYLDYACFARNSKPTILEIGAPLIAIEAKSLWFRGSYSEEHESQLEYYVTVSPAMQRGLGVLTNGAEWWVYDIAKPGEFGANVLPTWIS